LRSSPSRTDNRSMPTLVLALIVVYAVFFWLIHALAVRKPQ
jgi:hypothetical protein